MRFRAVVLACVASAVLVAACGNEDNDNGAGQAAAKTSHVTIAVGVDPVFTPIFVADAQGLFKKEGLDVDVRQFANAGEAADALVANGVDVAGVPDYNLLTRASRADLASLGIFAQDHGDYVKVVSDKDISDAKQMHKIGIVPGTFSEYAAARLVDYAGTDPASVKYVPAGPPELPPLLQKGNVDGFVIWPPWTTRATSMGGKILMPTRAYGLGTVLTVSTSDKWLKGHDREAKALMRAIAAAAQRTEADPAAAGDAAANAAKLPAPLVESAVKELEFRVRGFTADDRANFEKINDYLVKRKVTDTAPKLDELITTGYVPAQ